MPGIYSTVVAIFTAIIGTVVAIYWDVLKSRLKPHVEAHFDMIGRFLHKPPATKADAIPAAIASRVNANPPLNWHDWTEGEIPALGIRASWAWGRDGAEARPRCPACDAPLDIRVAGGLASGDPLRTRISCPSGHFAEPREGTPEEFMESVNREVNRMREQGEWSTATHSGRTDARRPLP